MASRVDPRPGWLWCIEWHQELGSTMDRATCLAEAGAPCGTVVVADHQLRGRGTHGREWLAEPGTCLMFTLIVHPDVQPADLAQLPVRIAISVAAAVEAVSGIRVEVHEPNDLMVGGKKMCGVLCTSRIVGGSVEWVQCGIGINTNMPVELLPLTSATSLQIENGGALVDHGKLLESTLERLCWLRDAGVPSCAGYADKPILSYQVQ